MENKLLNEIKLSIKIDLDNQEISKLLFNSLNLESDYNPNDRAKSELKLEKNILKLSITAKDSISARASINSFLKWINLSLELIKEIN